MIDDTKRGCRVALGSGPSIHGSGRVGSGQLCGSPWVTQTVTINAIGKLTFIELKVLLMFEFRCTLKLKCQPNVFMLLPFHRTNLKLDEIIL